MAGETFLIGIAVISLHAIKLEAKKKEGRKRTGGGVIQGERGKAELEAPG